MADNSDQQPSSLSRNEIMVSVSDQVSSFLKRTPLIIVIMFFLLSPKQTTVLAASDQVGGGYIQPPTWLLEWLNSGDISLQKLNLQCKKVPDNNAGKGWTLRCENSPGGGGDRKSQTIFLRLDNSQENSHPHNETGKSLCCHPCNYTPPQPPPPPPPPTCPLRPIITWVIDKIKTSTCYCTRTVGTFISVCKTILVTSISIWKRIVVESVSELTTVVGINVLQCQYHSVTWSTEFEMELKKMLQEELLRMSEKTKEKCESKACLDRYPDALRHNLKNNFNDLLKKSFQEISKKLQGTVDSAAGIELNNEHKQISSMKQANYAEVTEHHKQISVEKLHIEEVIKQEEIVVEESAEVIKHQEIFVEESAEVIKHEEIAVEESAEVIKHQEIVVEESAEVIKHELKLPTAT